MISINLTIHNKDFLLRKVLSSIKTLTTQDYELVCVLDGCNDLSEQILDTFIKENSSLKIKKLTAPNVFETKANNLAAANSEGEYIIIVQDDMIITELGWDERILKPFDAFGDVFAVTSRTAHNWIFNPSSQHVFEKENRNDMWSDVLFHTDHAHKDNLGREIFGVRDCVNRGPLAINRAVFNYFGGFNEEFAPQDMDDHDFCYRVAKETDLRCGCYPIGFISEDDWGGTRENGSPKPWFYETNQKNTKLIWEKHKDFIQKSANKNRDENRVLK